jgi:signal peptidase I
MKNILKNLFKKGKKPQKPQKPTSTLGKLWYFIWHDDSLASWLVNIVLAFVIIKFLVYPFLSLVLGTSLPLVAVVSESMDHGYTKPVCRDYYKLCDKTVLKDSFVQFDEYWAACGGWYETKGLSVEQFKTFPLTNGFSKGDIMILSGKKIENIEVGDIIVFQSAKPYPIIHRVVAIHQTSQGYTFETKGDHNEEQIAPPLDKQLDEKNIKESQIIGVARAKIPYLGWIKVGLFDLIKKNSC